MEQYDFPVTLYSRSSHYHWKHEVNWLAWEVVHIRNWIYSNEIFLKFDTEHCRSEKQLLLGDNSHFVILKGWGQPNHNGKLQLDHCLYLPFSTKWVTDFDEFIEQYKSSGRDVEMLFDGRKHDFRLPVHEAQQKIQISFREGSPKSITLNVYERSAAARNKCLEYHGTSCSICSFNFFDAYGDIGSGFIHVHHLKPLSEIGHEYEVNPITDLCPVCPNCHAMIHRKAPPFTLEEMKAMRKGANEAR